MITMQINKQMKSVILNRLSIPITPFSIY